MSREALIAAAKLIASLAEEVADLRADAADFDRFAADADALLTRAQHAELHAAHLDAANDDLGRALVAERELRATFQGEAARAEETLAKVRALRAQVGHLPVVGAAVGPIYYQFSRLLDDILEGGAS